MTTWNDGRLDELSTRTDAGFKEVKGEIKDLRAEMQAGFARVDGRFEKVEGEIHRLANTIIGAGGVVTAAVLGTGIIFGLT